MFKVGQIVKPRSPSTWEKWYNVRYRIVELHDYDWAKLEPIIDDLNGMIAEMKKDINVDTEGWPLGVRLKVEISIEPEIYPLDEEEWEVISE